MSDTEFRIRYIARPAEPKKKRKYYRKCGVCGERYEQSDMKRTLNSPTGYLCYECIGAEHPEYETDEW